MDKCIKCGKPCNQILCKECFLAKNQIIKLNPLSVKFCIGCKKLFADKWKTANSLVSALSATAKSKIKPNPWFHIVSMPIIVELPEHKPAPGLKLEANLIVTPTATAEDYGELTAKYQVPLNILYTTCPQCSIKGTQYFEATIQIRNPSAKALPIIENIIGENCNKKMEVRGGYDYYFPSTKKSLQLSKQIQQKLGGKLQISHRLHTRDKMTSRDLYRTTILLKLPEFSLGDIIKIDDTLLKITNLGTKVGCIDILTRHKKLIDYPQTPQTLIIYKTTITRTHPHIEALHPTTYQSVRMENPLPKEMGQTIEVVVDDEKLFLAE
ncbi:MAG: NMD3-related protein [Candidatus Woesearchaeota archaeon]